MKKKIYRRTVLRGTMARGCQAGVALPIYRRDRWLDLSVRLTTDAPGGWSGEELCALQRQVWEMLLNLNGTRSCRDGETRTHVPMGGFTRITSAGGRFRAFECCVRLNRADADLKPNMFAEATILGTTAGKSALFIPREALIRTGLRNAVVLALGEGRFQPMEVTPGIESDDWIEIRLGLKEGDVVVTSGQFLIDSEASVRASFGRMEQTAPAASPAEQKR